MARNICPNEGTANVATIAIIATVINNSISVKPAEVGSIDEFACRVIFIIDITNAKSDCCDKHDWA